jgi:hypothetical protein
MRLPSDRPARNGGWIHQRLGVDGPAPRPALRRPAPPAVPIAPIEQRDRVYRALADELSLSTDHREHLTGRTRCLPPESLREGFSSLSHVLDTSERCKVANAVATRVGTCELLRGVPGFYFEENSWMVRPGPAGFLVPVPDVVGRIQGFQIRRDCPGEGGNRYTWLSSRELPGGTGTGAPVATWRPELALKELWVTEGTLKAAVAAHHLPACVVGVPGVSIWRGVPSVLAALAVPGREVVVAYDAEDRINGEVVYHREALALALHRAGFRVFVATWDGTRAKGIDDALLAGLSIDIQPWKRHLPPLVRPRGVQP